MGEGSGGCVGIGEDGECGRTGGVGGDVGGCGRSEEGRGRVVSFIGGEESGHC